MQEERLRSFLPGGKKKKEALNSRYKVKRRDKKCEANPKNHSSVPRLGKVVALT